MVSDLIARVEEHIANHEEGKRIGDIALQCFCLLSDDWPTIKEALLAARELEIRRAEGIHAPDLSTRLVEWSQGREVWLTGDDVLVELGEPGGCCGEGCSDCHDCDSMGCGSFSHVLSREPKIDHIPGAH